MYSISAEGLNEANRVKWTHVHSLLKLGKSKLLVQTHRYFFTPISTKWSSDRWTATPIPIFLLQDYYNFKKLGHHGIKSKWIWPVLPPIHIEAFHIPSQATHSVTGVRVWKTFKIYSPFLGGSLHLATPRRKYKLSHLLIITHKLTEKTVSTSSWFLVKRKMEMLSANILKKWWRDRYSLNAIATFIYFLCQKNQTIVMYWP